MDNYQEVIRIQRERFQRELCNAERQMSIIRAKLEALDEVEALIRVQPETLPDGPTIAETTEQIKAIVDACLSSKDAKQVFKA